MDSRAMRKSHQKDKSEEKDHPEDHPEQVSLSMVHRSRPAFRSHRSHTQYGPGHPASYDSSQIILV